MLVDGTEDRCAKEWPPLTSSFPLWIIGDLKELVAFTPLSPELHSQKFLVGILSETVWVTETDPELIAESHLLFVLICYSEYELVSSGQNLDLCQNLEVIPAIVLAYHLQRIDAILNNLTQSWVIYKWLKMRWRGDTYNFLGGRGGPPSAPTRTFLAVGWNF